MWLWATVSICFTVIWMLGERGCTILAIMNTIAPMMPDKAPTLISPRSTLVSCTFVPFDIAASFL